jgi:hypothetical protein
MDSAAALAGDAVDGEGDERPNEDALREHVLETARDLMQTRMGSVRRWTDCSIEVTDEAGNQVLTLLFSDAV